MGELTYVQKLEKDYLRIESKNKQYREATQELKEYLESTIPKIPTNEKPLILTKSLEIINRTLEGGG